MFKIGDRIQGKEGNGYAVTNDNMIEGEVIELGHNCKTMLVKILQTKEGFSLGEQYWVDNNENEFKLLRTESYTEISENNKLQRVFGTMDNLERELDRHKNNLEYKEKIIDKIKKDLAKILKEKQEVLDEIEITKEKIRKNNDDKKFKKIKEQIKIIKEMEIVDSVEFIEDAMYIKTNFVYATDEDDNRFKMNKYSIQIKPSKLDIRVYGLVEEYNRESAFTQHDPHPHVSGNTGKPCWGNTEIMLVELFEQEQYDIIVQIVIDYLQSFNIDDSAGKYIRNWDCVDEDDDIIENPYDNMATCNCCGCVLEEDDVYICYDCGATICIDCMSYINDEVVCDNCLNEHYTFSEIEDRYIDNDEVETCECCNGIFSSDNYDRIEAEDGSVFCSEDCAINARYSKCYWCDEWHKSKEMTEYDEEWYCENCIVEKLEECNEEEC